MFVRNPSSVWEATWEHFIPALAANIHSLTQTHRANLWISTMNRVYPQDYKRRLNPMLQAGACGLTVNNAKRALVLHGYNPKEAILLTSMFPGGADYRDLMRSSVMIALSSMAELEVIATTVTNEPQFGKKVVWIEPCTVKSGFGIDGMWLSSVLDHLSKLLRFAGVIWRPRSVDELHAQYDQVRDTLATIRQYNRHAIGIVQTSLAVFAEAHQQPWPNFEWSFTEAELSGLVPSAVRRELGLRLGNRWSASVVRVNALNQAVVNVGSKDHFPRPRPGEQAQVLVGNIYCPVLEVYGDELLIDVHQVRDIKTGMPVVLLGAAMLESSAKVTATMMDVDQVEAWSGIQASDLYSTPAHFRWVG